MKAVNQSTPYYKADNNMIVFPAVDIKEKRCVRLKQGKADQETVFSDDPVSVARHWEDCGAKWLHVVDLDGAFQGELKNFETIKEICSGINIPVQLGGGIRSLDSARKYFQTGVERIIIGTLALEDKGVLSGLSAEYPGRIGVSLDAEDQVLKSKGWVNDTGISVFDVLPDLKDAGVSFLVYTDISRDGMQSGVNIPAVRDVVENTTLPVIAAGGVSRLEDVKSLYELHEKGLIGVITGKAIYSGSLDFKQAVQWLQAEPDS